MPKDSESTQTCGHYDLWGHVVKTIYTISLDTCYGKIVWAHTAHGLAYHNTSGCYETMLQISMATYMHIVTKCWDVC